MAHTKVTKTYAQNTGAANTFSYSGSFDTFKESEVVVTLDAVKLTYTSGTINESASPREYSVDYTNKTVHIGGANLSAGTIIIRPETDMGSPTARATYTAGSSITATDLNNNNLQLLRKAMEYDEQKVASTGDTMTGDLTFGEDTKIIFEGATDDAYETTLTVTDPTADRTITLPNVTGTVVTTGDTGSVATGMIAADAITGAKIADDALDSEHYTDGSIDAAHLASSSVTTAKINADAITGAKIADDQIDSEHYVAGSIDLEHMSANSVDSDQYVDGSIDLAHMSANSVDSDQYVDGSIDLAHMSANSVDSDQYVDGSIDTAHIADLNVTTAKIANDAITNAKIADDSINHEHIGDGHVYTQALADSAVTTVKLGADAVTGAKIADDAIDSEHYTDGSIDTAHIGGTQVTAAKIASNAVTTAKITDDNVTTAKIADSNITLAKLASDLKSTSISDSDTQLPTSGAVVDYVAAQLQPFGGFEAIATEVAFPNTQPASGVVISIADAGGVVVNGSGTSTTGRTVGGTTVTINNIASNFNSSTVDAGVRFLVSSTGSGHIYNYHKATLKEADLLNLSNDINDFAARYRVNNGEPGANNDAGDLVFDTSASKMKVYDGSSWGEVTSTGDFKYLVMTNAGTTNAATLNGSNVTFDLKETSTGGSAAAITSAAQLIVSINGVIQKANTGTNPSGLDGFVMADADTITFCAAPASGDDIFIVQIGSAITPVTPSDGSVIAAKIGSGAVTTVKIADDAVTAAKIADDAVGAEHIEVLDSHLQLADSCNIKIGTGNDLQIYHDGTYNRIASDVRTDFIKATGSEHLAKFIPDGAVELYYDNSKTFETVSGGAKVTGELEITSHLEMGDGDIIKLGDGDDLQIYHNGTASYFDEVGTGGVVFSTDSFTVRDITSNENMIVATGDGTVDLYYDNVKTFATTNGGVHMGDSKTLYMGDGNDLKIYHDGTDNYWETSGGTTHFRVASGNRLSIDGSSGDVSMQGSSGKNFKWDNSTAYLNLNDNATATYGTGDDLKIYHNATNSVITNQTGILYIDSTASHLILRSNSIQFMNADGDEYYGYMSNDGEVALYYDGTKRLDTNASGITIFGGNGSGRVLPETDGEGYIGESNHRWNAVYATNGTIQTSDKNEKNTIVESDLGLDFVNQLKPVSYKWNKDDGKTYYGLIAQDVEETIVNEGKSIEEFGGLNKPANDPMGLNYSELISPLIKAVQELSAEVETLKTKVAALEAK